MRTETSPVGSDPVEGGGRPFLRIEFNDFPGHPLFSTLCASLADLGHHVWFTSCPTVASPRGDLTARQRLAVTELPVRHTMSRKSLLGRLFGEIAYGWKSARSARRHHPDVVVANQMPALSLLILCTMVRRVPVVVWLQDIQSGLAAVTGVPLRRQLAALVQRIERRALRRAALVMPISQRLAEHPVLAGIPPDRLHVRPNWGDPISVSQEPKDNAWSVLHDLATRPVVLYSGTLGLKHDGEVLVNIARRLQQDKPEARVVIASFGDQYEALKARAAEEGLTTFVALPLQPFRELSSMLAAADVLVVTLRTDASEYSVPSKVLNYLCAGRPIAALVARSNPIWELINVHARAGLATADRDALVQFVIDQLEEPAASAALGANARAYASTSFDTDREATELAALWRTVIEGVER